MSGAMSAVKARLLERKKEVQQLAASIIPTVLKQSSAKIPISTSVVTKSASSTLVEKKKDRQNVKGAKDERTTLAAAVASVEQTSEDLLRNKNGEAPKTFDDATADDKIFSEKQQTKPQSRISPQSDEVCNSTVAPAAKRRKMDEDMSLEDLLIAPSAKEKQNKKVSNEIMELLNKPTTKEKQLLQKFKSDGSAMQEFCAHGTRQECAKVMGTPKSCPKLHFKKIIQRHTDVSLGDCSFLNTCFHMENCKYIHYAVDYSTVKERQKDTEGGPSVAQGNEARLNAPKSGEDRLSLGENDVHADLHKRNSSGSTKSGSGKDLSSGKGADLNVIQKGGLMDKTKLCPAQWIQCDVRFFDFKVLGKFSVIMADPPWDIHMELPYGTMADEEMRRLPVQSIQDHGFFFLWVTGRAMELGRECLRLWGYKQIDELIWVKTNQLQRIIRTGRTGHWLNHGKEHCLIGAKGNPANCYRGLDCDVIVGEVRATSHKPDEIYGIIERLSPGTRKVELFGRAHNVQPNWITLGNQLDGVRLIEPEVVERFNERYPNGNCLPKAEEVMAYKAQQEKFNQHSNRGGRKGGMMMKK